MTLRRTINDVKWGLGCAKNNSRATDNTQKMNFHNVGEL